MHSLEFTSASSATMPCCPSPFFGAGAYQTRGPLQWVDNLAHRYPQAQCGHNHGRQSRSSGNIHHHWHRSPWRQRTGVPAFDHTPCAGLVPSCWSAYQPQSSHRIVGVIPETPYRIIPYHIWGSCMHHFNSTTGYPKVMGHREPLRAQLTRSSTRLIVYSTLSFTGTWSSQRDSNFSTLSRRPS